MTSIQAIVFMHILLTTTLAYQFQKNVDYELVSNTRRQFPSDQFVREDTQKNNNPILFPTEPIHEGNLPTPVRNGDSPVSRPSESKIQNPTLSSIPSVSRYSHDSPINPNINRKPTNPNLNPRPSVSSNLDPHNLNKNEWLPKSSFSSNSQDKFPSEPPSKPGFNQSPEILVRNLQPSKSPSKRPDSSGSQSFSKAPLTSIAVDKFSLDLLRSQSSKNNRENIVMSPISITSLLSILLFASKGHTQDEIRSALYLNNIPDKTVEKYFKNILESFKNLENGVIVHMGSRLYIQRNQILVPNFFDLISTVYDATIEKVDFVNNSFGVMNEVNSWVNQLTLGHIPNLMASPFSPTTVFSAVNAIYFNGDWSQPFPKLLTQSGTFQTGFKNISIPMMGTDMTQLFFRDARNEISMVALPYQGHNYAMYIITHDGPPGSIDKVEKDLTPDRLNAMINNMVKLECVVILPRMRLKNRINLRGDLRDSNVHSIFTPTLADLSGMTQQTGAYVSDIITEAVIEITEIGTVGAAAAGVSTNKVLIENRLEVNKPSLLFIRNMLTGETLFMIKVVDPEPIVYEKE